MARHLMHPDPEAGPPPLVPVLWLIVLVLSIVLTIGGAAPAG